jgi:hypothetical protein
MLFVVVDELRFTGSCVAMWVLNSTNVRSH